MGSIIVYQARPAAGFAAGRRNIENDFQTALVLHLLLIADTDKC